jgi:alkylation response protein AidB-like acyl-CoA dehydrogenase
VLLVLVAVACPSVGADPRFLDDLPVAELCELRPEACRLAPEPAEDPALEPEPEPAATFAGGGRWRRLGRARRAPAPPRYPAAPVDLELSPDDRDFLEDLRAWLRKHLPRAWTRAPHGQESAAEGDAPALRAFQRELHAAGYLGIGWPEAYGGHAGSALRRFLVDEELVRERAPSLIGLLGVAMAGPTLLQCGSEAQKRRFLPKLLSAEELWCQGYSEPGSGSDLASLRTRGELQGDAVLVTGHKIWTTNAHFADWMFALVRTDPEAPKHAGISYLLIDMKSPGITVRPLLQMTKDAGFNEVFFDRVRVPLENVVGGLHRGWAVANATLGHERDMLGSSAHTRNLFDGLLRVARRATRGGRPAVEDPLLRQRLAELRIQVEAMRLHALRALSDSLRGRPPGLPGMVTKLDATWLNHRIAELALEILGGQGPLYRGSRHLVDGGFWPREWMFSLGMIIGGGTAQIQKNIIAQRGLGLPRGG